MQVTADRRNDQVERIARGRTNEGLACDEIRRMSVAEKLHVHLQHVGVNASLNIGDYGIGDARQRDLLAVGGKTLGDIDGDDDTGKEKNRALPALDEHLVDDVFHEIGGECCRRPHNAHEKEGKAVAAPMSPPLFAQRRRSRTKPLSTRTGDLIDNGFPFGPPGRGDISVSGNFHGYLPDRHRFKGHSASARLFRQSRSGIGPIKTTRNERMPRTPTFLRGLRLSLAFQDPKHESNARRGNPLQNGRKLPFFPAFKALAPRHAILRREPYSTGDTIRFHRNHPPRRARSSAAMAARDRARRS